jgi:hypothetical protein
VTPAGRCRDWVEKRWLETETFNGRLRYRLSPYSLRALRFVRELVEGFDISFRALLSCHDFVGKPEKLRIGHPALVGEPLLFFPAGSFRSFLHSAGFLGSVLPFEQRE